MHLRKLIGRRSFDLTLVTVLAGSMAAGFALVGVGETALNGPGPRADLFLEAGLNAALGTSILAIAAGKASVWRRRYR